MEELGITKFNKPILEVWNKIDLINLTHRDKSQFANQKNVVLISAEKKIGIEDLKIKISELFNSSKFQENILIPFNKNKIRSWLFEKKLVVKEQIIDDGFLLIVLWDELYKNKYLKKMKLRINDCFAHLLVILQF